MAGSALSPQQVAARLVVEYPDDPVMRVSHETIYTSLFVQAKKGLPGELTVRLRTGRVRRRPQRRVGVRPDRIPDLVPIARRPAEVADRVVPGYWEGDLVGGRRNLSYVGTLVERTSRYLVLLHLPDGGGSDGVLAALTAAMDRLPAELRRSITWDRGIQMIRHTEFTAATGIPVFFCDARSPWQRGSNENTVSLVSAREGWSGRLVPAAWGDSREQWTPTGCALRWTRPSSSRHGLAHSSWLDQELVRLRA